ncbi:Virulence factors putative positive transcription regulator BvgA [Pseudomonas fluorescens]|uniref:Virulence factors putative positive transcription regulator BvgA n=1 Tax=Pseudomonas fluorescens TaxID=294 RepID=A0A5E7UVX0_PSEFL|nr:response regulator transcription factor [Pseudomonas fluorescens]VVQ11784.1 Virulence factors putative positive transcription regulator BvgA [Pseudomonas fluorescens]
MRSALIVDDHPVVRAAVKIVLQAESFKQIHEVANGEQVMEMIREHSPQLVVLDLNLPGLSGLDVIVRIKANYPACRILVFSLHAPEIYQERCLRAGAMAYVTKSNQLQQLHKAIQALMAGYSYFSALTDSTSTLNAIQLSEKQMIDQLSDRELAILLQLAQGKANKIIAQDMHLSHKTVSTYKTRLMIKLGILSLVMLREFAQRNGLI